MNSLPAGEEYRRGTGHQSRRSHWSHPRHFCRSPASEGKLRSIGAAQLSIDVCRIQQPSFRCRRKRTRDPSETNQEMDRRSIFTRSRAQSESNRSAGIASCVGRLESAGLWFPWSVTPMQASRHCFRFSEDTLARIACFFDSRYLFTGSNSAANAGADFRYSGIHPETAASTGIGIRPH